MFSKSKRFDEKPVGCGADVPYSPKDLVKPVGGVIPKVDRFAEFKKANSVHSDAESIHSEKSSQIFRTPKAIRRNPFTSFKNKNENGDVDYKSLMEEMIAVKNVEIKNKDDTIKEYEMQIADMKNQIYNFESAVKDLEAGKAKELDKLSTENALLSEENEKLKSNVLNLQAELKFLNEQNEESVQLLDELRNEKANIEIVFSDTYDSGKSMFENVVFIKNAIDDKDSEISMLNRKLSDLLIEVESTKQVIEEKELELSIIPYLKERISELETKTAELNSYDERRSLDILAMSDLINVNNLMCEELKDKLSKKDVQINELMENVAMVRGQHALALEANESIRHEYKVEIDSLKVRHNDELVSMDKQYRKQIEQNKRMVEDLQSLKEEHNENIQHLKAELSNQVKHYEENATEKVRICEIQFEERYNDLQAYSEAQINHERKVRDEDLQICQELAEKEMMNSGRQINELRNALEANNQRISELSSFVEELRDKNNTKENLLNKLQADIEMSRNTFLDQKLTYENRIIELKVNVDKLAKDKSMFAIALDTTRQTVEVLGNRLRNSDACAEDFKKKLDSSLSLNKMYEAEIVELQIEFSSFKDEYTQLLTSIVNSKTTLDKSHNEILENNTKLSESFESIKEDVAKNIFDLKSGLLNEIDEFKKQAQITIDDLLKRIEEEHNSFEEMKNNCDQAYTKIGECRELLSAAESQLETKDQELIELGSENDRLSGTLAASEQEKSEFKVLLEEFVKLVEIKDMRIYDLTMKIEKLEDEVYNAEDRAMHMTQLLEATEFVIKEKDAEINRYQEDALLLNEEKQNIEKIHEKLIFEHEHLKNDNYNYKIELEKLQVKVEEMNNDNESLKECLKKVENNVMDGELKIQQLEQQLQDLELHMAKCEEESLRIHCENIEVELKEMTEKYTNLLGHQNNRQKIKHMADLKSQNSTLKGENEKLSLTVQKQSTLIDKLKKDMNEGYKSPLVQKKQLLQIHSPHGKENRSSSRPQSPNVIASPMSERQLTPLRDLNR